MVSLFKTSAANLTLRGLSTLSKLLLLILITRYLTIEDLGIYGLFTSSVMIALYFLGFDYYYYSSREILSNDSSETGKIIKNQFVFYLFSYIVVLPPLVIIFLIDILPVKYIIVFYLVLILDHISIEFYRILVTLSRSVFANVIFFIKSGLWVYILILIWLLNISSTINLDFVWYGWLTGALLACIIAAIYIGKLNFGIIKSTGIDWIWIRKGLIISIPFILSTISLRLTDFSGRYFLDQIYSKSIVGIYSFFWSVASLVYVFVITAVIMILYPPLVKTYKEKKLEEFRKIYLRFKKLIIVSTILMSLLLAIMIHPILQILNKSEFYAYIDAFYILLLANIFIVFSYIPHYILYARDQDRFILISSIIGLVVNIILNIILIPKYSINGASVALTASYASVFFAKYVFNRVSSRN